MNLRPLVILLLALSWWAQPSSAAEADRIQQLIADYAALASGDDSKLTEVWDNSPDVSFIHPLGEAHGIEEVRRFFHDILGGMLSERKLVPRDIKVHVYG